MTDHRKRLARSLLHTRQRLVWGTVEKYPRTMAPVRLRDAEIVLHQLARAEDALHRIATQSRDPEMRKIAAEALAAQDEPTLADAPG